VTTADEKARLEKKKQIAKELSQQFRQIVSERINATPDEEDHLVLQAAFEAFNREAGFMDGMLAFNGISQKLRMDCQAACYKTGKQDMLDSHNARCSDGPKCPGFTVLWSELNPN
jgi:hypothetical protein